MRASLPLPRTCSRMSRSRPRPSSSSSTPDSPHLVDALSEALHDSLPLPPPRRPPAARLPPLLSNLIRSTLPTATLSPPAAPYTLSSSSSVLTTVPTGVARGYYDSEQIQHPQVVLSHSPPGRSSIDSLRVLRDRSRSRAPASASTSSSTLDTDPTTGATGSTPVPQPASSTSGWPTSWWWFSNENKENVDTLLDEDDRGDTVEHEQDKMRKKYRAPKNPLVFCHGLLGFDSVTIGPAIAPMQVSHWRGIKEVLEANGAEVLITRVPATSSPVERAKVLERRISEVYPGRSVHLIGHSMGGLDCRYLTTHLTQRTFTVLSITTIATPHRGSAFADHFLSTIGAHRLPAVLALLDLLPNGGGDGSAFTSLTRRSMAKFNEEVPDVAGVRYFSWGAVYEPGLIDTWKYSHSVILAEEGPNDGLVSIESSKWGTYLGTLHDVNHLDLIGWLNAARYKWAALTGREIKFRPATFYLGVADYLAWEVEGQKREEAEEHGHSRREGREGGRKGRGAEAMESWEEAEERRRRRKRVEAEAVCEGPGECETEGEGRSSTAV